MRNHKGLKKTARFAYPAGVMSRYANKLQALVLKMQHGVDDEILHFFHRQVAKNQVFDAAPSTLKSVLESLTATYTTLFNKQAWELAQQAVDDMDEASDAAVRINSEALVDMFTINSSLSKLGLKTELDAAVKTNVSLIKSIPKKYLSQIVAFTRKAFDTGRGLADVQEGLHQYGAQAQRRAKFIAEDQTRKTYNGLNAKRATNLGLDLFQWLHSGGGLHPRPYHLDVLNDQVFSFSDPPVIDDDTGETGLPGDLPNCGCTFMIVVPGSQEAEDYEKEGGADASE